MAYNGNEYLNDLLVNRNTSYYTDLVTEMDMGVEVFTPDELVENMADVAAEELEITLAEARPHCKRAVDEWLKRGSA